MVLLKKIIHSYYISAIFYYMYKKKSVDIFEFDVAVVDTVLLLVVVVLVVVLEEVYVVLAVLVVNAAMFVMVVF